MTFPRCAARDDLQPAARCRDRRLPRYRAVRSSSSASRATWPARSCSRRSTTSPTGPAADQLRAARASPAATGRTRTSPSCRARPPGARPHAVARGGLGAARRHHVRPRRVRRRRRLRLPRRHPRRAGEQPRDRRQRRVLPLHPPGDVPDRAQADAAHGMAETWTSGAGSSSRSPSATTCPPAASSTSWSTRCSAPTTSSDRPLPGQGDGPEPAGAAVRQHAVRAHLERPPRRLGADHHGRGRRHRPAGAVLREDRRRPRRAAEPPAAAAGPDRDGGAGRVLRRGDPHREAQGAARDLRPGGQGDLRRPRSVRAGLARRGAGQGLPAEDGVGRSPRPRPSPRSGSAWRRAAGPACPSTCAPASGCPAGSPRSRWCSSGPTTLPFADTDTEELGNNQLVIRVQPDEGVTLKFGSKVPAA